MEFSFQSIIFDHLSDSMNIFSRVFNNQSTDGRKNVCRNYLKTFKIKCFIFLNLVQSYLCKDYQGYLQPDIFNKLFLYKFNSRVRFLVTKTPLHKSAGICLIALLLYIFLRLLLLVAVIFGVTCMSFLIRPFGTSFFLFDFKVISGFVPGASHFL